MTVRWPPVQPSQTSLVSPAAQALFFTMAFACCSGWFRFVAEQDKERRFYFTAIQSLYGRALATRLGIDPENPATNAVLLDGQVFLRSDSAIAALSALPGWRLIGLLRMVPKPLRDAFYSFIARNRY